MADFRIPDTPAPPWNAPEQPLIPVSDQVADLLEVLQKEGGSGGVRAVMQGLAVLDRAVVYNRRIDPSEWQVASAALRHAFAQSPGKSPSGNAILGALVDAAERARSHLAEEPAPLGVPATFAAIAKSHQHDRQFATVWDAERCAASSIVAALAVLGKPALLSIAHEIGRLLDGHQASIAATLETLRGDNDKAKQKARKTILPFMQIVTESLNLRLETVLVQEGWSVATATQAVPGIFVERQQLRPRFWVCDSTGQLWRVEPLHQETQRGGVRALKTDRPPDKNATFLTPPKSHQHLAPPSGSITFPDIGIPVQLRAAGPADAHGLRPVKTLAGHSDPRPFAIMSAIAQIAESEPRLYKNTQGVIEAEQARITKVIQEFAEGALPSQLTLQKLADTLLFAGRNIAHGLNLHPAEALLNRADIPTLSLPNNMAEDVPTLVRTSQPGKAYILASRTHAAALLHLADGQRWFFDSESIFGIQDRSCLASFDPKKAPRRAQALLEHYKSFHGLLCIDLTSRD